MKVIRFDEPGYEVALAALDRRAEASAAVREVVTGVVDAIRERGDAALLEFTAKFDGVQLTPTDLRVSEEDIAEAWAAAAVTPTEPGAMSVKDALEASQRNVFEFARRSLRQDWSMTNEQGAEVGEVFHPFERVGIYVPGGTAPLVSTSLMTVTLAAAAGVPEIVVCTPCGRDGKVNAALLAALKLAGATEVYKVGGAQAIAAMAFGTATIRPVAKIFGPGNSYVVEAKRQTLVWCRLICCQARVR